MHSPNQNKGRTDWKPVVCHAYSKPRLTVYGHVGSLTQGGTGGRAEYVNKIGMQQMNPNRRG